MMIVFQTPVRPFFLRSCAIRTLLGFIIIHEGKIQFLTSKTHVLNIVILVDVDGQMEVIVCGMTSL